MSQGESGGGHGGASGRWLVSYADFITLLMVVFMILYSMARVDSAKFGRLKASLQASSIGGPVAPLPVGGNPVNTAPTQPGPDANSYPGKPSPVNPMTAVPNPVPATPPIAAAEETPAKPADKPTEPAPAEKPAPEQKPAPAPASKSPVDPMETLKGSLQGMAAARAGSLQVQIQDRGVVLSILTSVLFPEGSAELKPGAAKILDQIVGQLQGTDYPILVEGSPDASAKDAPWDLASRRASNVVGYLVGAHLLPADRFAVIGYGKGAGVDGIVNVVVLRQKS